MDKHHQHRAADSEALSKLYRAGNDFTSKTSYDYHETVGLEFGDEEEVEGNKDSRRRTAENRCEIVSRDQQEPLTVQYHKKRLRPRAVYHFHRQKHVQLISNTLSIYQTSSQHQHTSTTPSKILDIRLSC
jgi:hypothetical protein